VRAHLCARPEDWIWGSYRSAIGLSSVPGSLPCMTPLTAFGADVNQARSKFTEFVLMGMMDAPAEPRRVPSVAGTDFFIERLESLVPTPSPEYPRAERAFRTLGTYEADASSRNEAIRTAFASGRYTQAEIARYFGLHYTTICRIVGNASSHDAKKQDATPQ